MHIIQVSWFILLVNTFLIETIHASLSEQLYEILKRLIQTECNCSPYHCCSKWGYCGLTDAYCGDGCQSGPCKNPPAKPAYQSLHRMFLIVFFRMSIQIFVNVVFKV